MARTVSLRGGRFDQTTPDDLAEAFSSWSHERNRLVLHFHGGLVSHTAGVEIAERLQPLYEEAGSDPLFVLWQSGLRDVITDDLATIAREKIFKRMLARVMQFVVGRVREGSDGSRGITIDVPDLEEITEATFAEADGEPFAGLAVPVDPLSPPQVEQLSRVLDGDKVIRLEAEKIRASLVEEEHRLERGLGSSSHATETTMMSPAVLEEIRAGDRAEGDRGFVTTARIVKGVVATVMRVLHRLSRGRDHGIYATSVEELLREFYLARIGGMLWRQMKQDTADAFGDDPDCHGGTAIISHLASRERWPTPPVLIGHSAGAVYICNFLTHADPVLPEQCKFDVAMLAPACDFQLMDKTLSKHGARIRRLQIFSMKDEKERADRMAPPIYPRSLLYFISGLLEKEADWPLLGMERYHMEGQPYGGGDFPEIDRVRSAIAEKPGSFVWSIAAGGPGLTSNAISHGDFDSDKATLESVCHFIATS